MKENKVVNATTKGISIHYVDSKKHYFVNYEKFTPSDSIERNTISRNYDEVLRLNPKQLKLYRVAIYGVEALSDVEKSHLDFKKKFEIEKNKRMNKININKWKQSISCNTVDNILSRLFPNSALVLEITSINNDYMEDFSSHISFKSLGVSFKNMIDKMIEFKALPQDFYALK